jgi:hypothetical protein
MSINGSGHEEAPITPIALFLFSVKNPPQSRRLTLDRANRDNRILPQNKAQSRNSHEAHHSTETRESQEHSIQYPLTQTTYRAPAAVESESNAL